MRISDWISDVCSSDLSALGYRAFGWGLGHNFSLRTIGADGEKLGGRIAAIAEETGEPVTLIGVSLGGIMARFAAQRWPDQVREVITVASPFAGNPRATNLWRTYEWLTGERVDSPRQRSEEHTSELQSLMRISYAVFCLKKKKSNGHIKKLD